jgi:hypothetical protein
MYVLMEKCTAIKGWQYFVFIPTRCFPPPQSLLQFEQVCIHRYQSALNRETYEDTPWTGKRPRKKYRVVVRPASLDTSIPPDTSFTIMLCTGEDEVFGNLWDMLLYALDYRVFGSYVQVVYGMMDLTPYRKCKLQLGHNTVVVPSHPLVTTVEALLPLLRSQAVLAFMLPTLLTPSYRVTYSGAWDEKLEQIEDGKLSARQMHSRYTYDELCHVWRLVRSLPHGPRRTWLNAAVTAAMRLTSPLAHPTSLRFRALYLPKERHLRILQLLKDAIGKDEGLHPIVADFYCQHLQVVVSHWWSLGRTLVNVYRQRKHMSLDVAAVPCTCAAFCRRMSNEHGWQVPLVDGHAFFAGHQYAGPCSELLTSYSLSDVPRPDCLTVVHEYTRSVCSLLDQLQVDHTQQVITSELIDLLSPIVGTLDPEHHRLTVAESAVLCGVLAPLVVCGIDRNLRMAHCSCLRLYNKAAVPVYSGEQYKPAHVLSYNPVALEQAWGGVESLGLLPLYSLDAGASKVSKSNYHLHLNRSIAWVYRKAGLAELASLNVSGGRFGLAYILFKWKYLREVRHPKLLKPRPISPMCDAIDAWFMSRVTKLGVLLCKLLPSSAMLLHTTGGFAPGCNRFVSECAAAFDGGEYQISNEQFDVAGMYPSLEHRPVITAASWALECIASRPGGHSQTLHVTKHGKAAGGLGTSYGGQHLILSFEHFVAAWHIALATGFVWFGVDVLLIQLVGVPQGHPMSVWFAKCITAYACYMWVTSVQSTVAEHGLMLHGVCFIDDINLFIACPLPVTPELAAVVAELFRSFQASSFPPSCELEADETGGYLECFVQVTGKDILVSHNTKIDLLSMAFHHGSPTLLRLLRWDSYVPRSMLHGIFIGTCIRCLSNTSHLHLAVQPMHDIGMEFGLLGFPRGVLAAGVRRVGAMAAKWQQLR